MVPPPAIWPEALFVVKIRQSPPVCCILSTPDMGLILFSGAV